MKERFHTSKELPDMGVLFLLLYMNGSAPAATRKIAEKTSEKICSKPRNFIDKADKVVYNNYVCIFLIIWNIFDLFRIGGIHCVL